jgi:hypothetical protein
MADEAASQALSQLLEQLKSPAWEARVEAVQVQSALAHNPESWFVQRCIAASRTMTNYEPSRPKGWATHSMRQTPSMCWNRR